MRFSLTFAVTALTLTACGGDGGGTPPPPVRHPAAVSVSISPAETMASIGDTRSLTAVVRDSSDAVITDASVQWSSSAPTKVSITPTTGLATTATGVSDGIATISATSGTVAATVSAALQQRLVSAVVSPATVPLLIGGERQLSATGQDARGNAIPSISGFNFSSNNTGVATVSPPGLVTAVAAGSATITASVTRDGVTATSTSAVTVTSAFPSSATVTTTNSAFVPSLVQIARGGTVTWEFGPTAHNVNFEAGAVAGIPSTSSAAVSRVFPNAGSFPYHCTLHSGMTGTVNVN